MAIPAYGGASTAKAEGTTTVAPGIPSGVSTGDLMLAVLAGGNLGAWTVADQGGGSWTEIGQAQVGSGTATANVTIFSDYYNGSQTAPTFNSPANNGVGRIIFITGARDADEVTFAGLSADLSDSSGDTACSLVSGFSTTDDECLIVLVAGAADDSPTFGATWTNANLANINVRLSDTTTSGNDSSLDVVTGELATAGAVGTFANTLTAAVNVAALVLAIRPPDTNVALTIAEATHGHSADNLALTQHNVLAIQDATHGHTADNAVLGVGLVVQDALHAHTADNLALTQHHVLAIADATHGHTAENQALTQHNILAIQDATHGHAADNLALTQHNVLAVADAAHAHAADNLALTPHEPGAGSLEIQDAAHAHTADALVLGVGLVIADATHGHAADNLELTQHNVLAIADALHAHTAEVPQLSLPGETPTQQDFVRLRRRRGMGTR